MIYRVAGPCTILYGTSLASLGKTKTGPVIRSTVNWVPIVLDEGGGEPVDYIYAGRAMTVEIVGVDIALIKKTLFRNTLLGNARSSVGVLIDEVVGHVNQRLRIVERDGSYWEALIAEPVEPTEVLLEATSEFNIPIIFLIVPDASGKLFSTLPTYIKV